MFSVCLKPLPVSAPYGYCDLTGLEEFADKRPHMLSGGMKQRAAFCRALLADPRLLLLDEPFGALDALTREELSLELSRLWQDLGRTALLITHDIDEAILLGDRVIVLSSRPGRIRLDMPIDLPRPRDVNTEKNPRFVEITQTARRLLFSRDERVTRMAIVGKPTLSQALTPLIYIVAVVLWEAAARVFHIPGWILPAPSAIASTSVVWAPELVFHSIATLRETIIGFMVALIFSVPLAIVIAFTSLLRRVLYPILLGLQSIPKVALAPLVILWLGVGNCAENRHRDAGLLLPDLGQFGCWFRSHPQSNAGFNAFAARVPLGNFSAIAAADCDTVSFYWVQDCHHICRHRRGHR